MWWFLQLIEVVFGIPIGLIWWNYIIAPGKSVREGLLDYIHESDDDI